MSTSPRVVYIVGSTRSGSTLLDLLLGTIPGVVSLGEARYFWERGVLQGRGCSCGREAKQCPVWGDRPPWVTKDRAGQVVAWQRRHLRTRHFRAVLHGEVPGAQDYCTSVLKMYASVAERQDAEVVVDSSKLPADAALLLALGVDVRVVHLVRDLRGVAHSWSRRTHDPDATGAAWMARKSTIRATRDWVGANVAAALLRRRHPDAVLSITYEDLCEEPQATLDRVTSHAGIDRARLDQPPATTHLIGGNPLRNVEGPLVVRADHRWQSEMSASRRRLLRAIDATTRSAVDVVGGERCSSTCFKHTPRRNLR